VSKLDFSGKSVVITGASSGLGATLAREFSQTGANVALFAPNEPELREVTAECIGFGSGSAIAVVGDVTLPEDCRRLTDETVAAFGQIDYVIANAGISMWAIFEEIEDLSVFRKLMEVNYLGAVHTIHPAIPYLKQSGGLIAAITSIQARIPVPHHTGYVASKHALQGFLETLRMELAGTGVDILTVLPHWLRGTNLRREAFGKDGSALGDQKRKHNKESVGLEQASGQIMQAIYDRKRELVIPRKLKALTFLKQIAPKTAEGIIARAVSKQT
jgi:NAD(P)-dependent dehydrogenase (short-subunit alcohol dehydrogenase family)